jgi:chemotaxis protein CheX
MTNDDRATLDALLAEMCREMLAPNGEPFEIVLTDPALTPEPSMLATSIGLVGPDVKGVLVMITLPGFLRATYPPELSALPAGDDDLADWAGELANQLLGRLKNRLCTLGLDFNQSMPTVVRGDRLKLWVDDRPNSLGCRMRIRNERVDFYLEAIRPDGAALLAAGPRPTTASREGQGFLF